MVDEIRENDLGIGEHPFLGPVKTNYSTEGAVMRLLSFRVEGF